MTSKKSISRKSTVIRKKPRSKDQAEIPKIPEQPPGYTIESKINRLLKAIQRISEVLPQVNAKIAKLRSQGKFTEINQNDINYINNNWNNIMSLGANISPDNIDYLENAISEINIRINRILVE